MKRYHRRQGPHALLPPWHDYWGLDRIGSVRRCEAWMRRQERAARQKTKEKRDAQNDS